MNVSNPDYPTGMGSSVSIGVQAVIEAPEPPDGVVICLADMPDITAAMIDTLIGNFDPVAGRTIVAAAVGGRRGNPVLWDRRFADDLTSLGGDAGAREILREHAENVITVDLESDAVLRDLDTPEALDAYARTRDRDEGRQAE